MTVTKHFVLAAGGTGGHMIPAYALGAELMQRGHHVALMTDDRGAKIPGIFEKGQMHILPESRMAGGLLGWLRGFRGIMAGRKMAGQLFENFQPSAVVGFGGYPALPTLLAAQKAKIPTVIHEQNAVLGRVNRFMAHKVDAIATSYQDVERLDVKYLPKTHLVGNPVREEVLALRGEDYPPFLEGGVFRVLVTGGSQGAKILSEVVPDGLAMLPVNLRQRLQVTQQCRAEDIEAVRAKYADHDIPAQLATYIEDLPDKLGWSHLVIGRAGASTIAELTAAGRPAILIPLPGAMDDHQTVNVREMVAAGGARAIRQPNFTATELAKQIQKMALNPETLANAARGAWNCGLPNAVRDLADLVESMGGAPLTDVIRISGAERERRATGSPSLAKDTVEGHSA
ncbi:undecaprenyldiphospho-muramoylpentapeptide beta-N-acetylglucosaminyltransferase [Sphingorhabdus sp. Alg239-R122]|uniref:undecaprenyldiphospho-muramoylpentapeptide beta-N-acetylglucosaminyltransferase n=1 Tax=Sphingorhabdus sp. Alg239-R122 TaxID=2305989 RepID=UPI0013D9D8B9|nr:undecaprenyldiphospho-muramoylpentapeptide beta-N-acetylglucosaminyltransferase [Sphingorhabdus sp. Alg239-R122]